MRSLYGIGFVTVLFFTACSGACPAPSGRSAEPPPLPKSERRGAYLGETPPGSEPALFAPGFVSRGLGERDAAFAPSGYAFYYSVLVGGFEHSVIMETRLRNGAWTAPAVASFSGVYRDIEPAVSPDGSRLYFASDRPLEGNEGGDGDMNLWFAGLEGPDWGVPRPLPPQVNSSFKEFFPSPTRSGALYFCREDETGKTFVYRADRVEGGFGEAQQLPDTVNIGADRFNAFAAPDESYIIVCAYGIEGSVGGVDYWVSFRSTSGDWLPAVNMGEPVNTAGSREYSASVTADGKYLFFMSSRTSSAEGGAAPLRTLEDVDALAGRPGNGNSDIYWVSSEILESLKRKATGGGGA